MDIHVIILYCCIFILLLLIVFNIVNTSLQNKAIKKAQTDLFNTIDKINKTGATPEQTKALAAAIMQSANVRVEGDTLYIEKKKIIIPETSSFTVNGDTTINRLNVRTDTDVNKLYVQGDLVVQGNTDVHRLNVHNESIFVVDDHHIVINGEGINKEKLEILNGKKPFYLKNSDGYLQNYRSGCGMGGCGKETPAVISHNKGEYEQWTIDL